jgi:hypothetical protein
VASNKPLARAASATAGGISWLKTSPPTVAPPTFKKSRLDIVYAMHFSINVETSSANKAKRKAADRFNLLALLKLHEEPKHNTASLPVE